MKRSLQLLSMIFAFSLVLSGARISGALPVDTRSYVENKYTGWNGVLQAWICTNWSPGGSFTRWINDCAAAFEKRHDGVYFELIPVTRETLRAMDSNGLRRPDMIFFSPGTLDGAAELVPLDVPEHIRDDLLHSADGRAIPLALGGYIWVCNDSLCKNPPTHPSEVQNLIIPGDMDGNFFSVALVGLLSGDASAAEIQTPDAGLDLGLPTASILRCIQSDDAFDRFINGELPYIPVSQREISRLIQLRDAGRGPDWFLSPTGEVCYTDQLLLGAIPYSSDDAAAERSALCRSFLEELTGTEAQAKLAGVGAFSVNGQRIHPDFSAYAPLDALLCSHSLSLPDAFSEYSAPDFDGIVRAFLDGKFSAKDTLREMGFAGM